MPTALCVWRGAKTRSRCITVLSDQACPTCLQKRLGSLYERRQELESHPDDVNDILSEGSKIGGELRQVLVRPGPRDRVAQSVGIEQPFDLGSREDEHSAMLADRR